MSFQRSTESIIKQICSGIISGSMIGMLMSKGQYGLSYITFTSIGLIDIAYHLNYLKAHITHLTYDESTIRRDIRSRFDDLQRNIHRELCDPPDAFNQELEWLWNDIKRQIDRHIYYGLGFTMAFIMSISFLSRNHR